ncbi:Transcriptional regulator, contains XRE-family HTH domain [Desulfotomaculum arcticum]|uniref:Transcriptional regulator, contains XRE-family HTH domain n=1 Tax=Desulfotruncus arcticus DSM 17038 TaxID=1121424 RepID=A0A1I2R1H1_9FIRM|nr:XRE family transcriptional regulator [Desulfotruncus arcticus]SFG34524.1 Transcriptional regulator, contains XRE-family HTH domain [Desulfotomaculum arcticum] [Desulfotruncus arcticus DSM 17038]
MHISKIIGDNFARIRKARGLSLDKVAEQTGVSKPMLGQIERGESNPSIATVWKIVNGLHIPFSELITEKKPKIELVRRGEVAPIVDDEIGITVYPLFSFQQDRRFDIFFVIINANSSYLSEPHDDGSEEYILMMEGTLEVTVGEATFALSAGDIMKFQANRQHIYRCISGQTVSFYNIVYYNEMI